MNRTAYYFAAVLVMAVVTYLPRVLPMTLMRKKIESPFVNRFLEYMPYAVLGAMTFPSVLTATAMPLSAVIGTAVAIVLSLFCDKLLPVAVSASAAVWLTEWIVRAVG